jgi:hypothetical protein
MDVRGSAPQGFCGRNSALGVKGGFGNFFAGNWDMPYQAYRGCRSYPERYRCVWNRLPALFNNSSTFNDNASPSAFSRRQNNSIFYDTPEFRRLPGLLGDEHAFDCTGTHRRDLGCKASRLFVGRQLHQRSFDSSRQVMKFTTTSRPVAAQLQPAGPNPTLYGGDDTGLSLGAAYQFGPFKGGLLYAHQKMETSPGTSLERILL